MTWLLELVEKGDIWESFSWEGFPAAISPQGFKYISLQWLLQNSVKGWYLRKFQLIGFSCCHLSTFSRLRPVFPISSSKSWVGSSSSLESSFMKVEFLNVKPKMSKREFSFLLLWFYTSTNVPRSLEASKRHLKRQSLKQEVNHRDVKWQWYVCQVLLLFFYSLGSPLLFCYLFCGVHLCSFVILNLSWLLILRPAACSLFLKRQFLRHLDWGCLLSQESLDEANLSKICCHVMRQLCAVCMKSWHIWHGLNVSRTPGLKISKTESLRV